MNTSNLKRYAPAARKNFIAAVTRRAETFGLNPNNVATVQKQGDVLLINGKPHPAGIAKQREGLEKRIAQQGFAVVMEAMAYTWFNRLVAIRYMELHGYLDHGYRVLSHPDGGAQPEILEHISHLELPGLDKNHALELKLAGNRDEELYRQILLAQCHALHTAMPFLFEPLDDATELLLPEGLLRTDSLIRDLAESIEEAAWQQIEIIGWLYQFYISEKKDQVIGKVVASEDIPAATQLFTPYWIVKYMVQNSLGAQWLATYPDSKLKGQMEYYIEPAEQTDEVNAQLAAITPSQLNPEALTLIDPASGSGHILVEAYALFKAIYLERGYRQRDVPQLILEKNLFGLDIDERAAQLTGFALMMKGRADDRRLFERGVKLNVMALVDSAEFDAEGLAERVDLADYELKPGDLVELKRLFEHATTFGSLIQVPQELVAKLSVLKQLSEAASQDLFVSEALKRLGPLAQQAELLGAQYDAVVANPPYMGSKGMTGVLKKFAKDNFADAKSDLFACFIERGFVLAKDAGHNAMVTMQSWMFLSSFEKMRKELLRTKTIGTMAHLGARAFGSISGEVVQTTACVLKNSKPKSYKPLFVRLVEGAEDWKRTSLVAGKFRFFGNEQSVFGLIPGSPIAYWVSSDVLRAFHSYPPLSMSLTSREGLTTGNNDRFLRLWSEVCIGDVSTDRDSESGEPRSSRRWNPYVKGGDYRRWEGNREFVLDWLNGGEEVLNFADETTGRIRSHNYNGEWALKTGLTWSSVSGGTFCIRHVSSGFMFDTTGTMAFCIGQVGLSKIEALLNSNVAAHLMQILSPSFRFQPQQALGLPCLPRISERAADIAGSCICNSRKDWDAYERSWDFQSLPLLTAATEPASTLEASYTAWITQNKGTIAEMKRLEEENNRLFIDAYGLADELTPDVSIEQITLTVNPAYRYGGKLTEEEQWTRFRQDTMEELVSYAIGCMMGRYSLDEPGLIYAHSGNEGFDAGKYDIFPADDDGIVPLTDTEWFSDDACNRVVEFVSMAWDAGHLEDNLRFLADNLSPRNTETPRETLRRYLCDSFFKDHLQTYKKRPIYWLFSSGKQKAFQCLVYLHRYNAGTISRMRMEYVVPLQSRMQARIDSLEQDAQASSSSAEQKRLQKQRDTLVKQLDELRRYDEQLRHYADQRISIDLDDGVKVNYGKFGDLLAEVPAITGKKKKAA